MEKKQGWQRLNLVAVAAWSAVMVGMAALPRHVEAAKRYEFTGKVTGVRGDTLYLSRGLDTLEFSRSASVKASRELGTLKVGDEVTIWYRLDAVRAEAISGEDPRQKAGRAAPGMKAPDLKPGNWDGVPSIDKDGVPLEKKRILLDDRAFYDARNHAAPSSQIDPSG